MSTAAVLRSSESVEWYTPGYLLAVAREVMGPIALDPASCPEANETAQARRIYTAADDGLRQTWTAESVWMNPPYGRSAEDNASNQQRWLHKLLDEWRRGHVGQAMALVNAVPGNKWFRPLWAHPLCFIEGRIAFVPPAGSKPRHSPTHSSVVVYLGPKVDDFVRSFSKLGAVVLPHQVAVGRAQRGLL